MTMTQADKNSRALAVDHLMADLGRRAASGGALAIGAQARIIRTLIEFGCGDGN